LHIYAREKGYQFEYGRPWWTLPIRLIRRKNVVEALLLAAMAEDSPQLLITLDANSEPERPYAEAVKELFRKEKYAAVVGFGHELVGSAFSFDDLLLASDVVVSTSLLEGFGFTFLEGANRGRPLVGRNLNDVTSDFVDAGFPATALYDEFLVPIDGQTRKEMINKGQRFAQEQGRLLRLNHSTVDRFSKEVEAIFSNTAVDFGFLELSQQIHLAGLLRRGDLLGELKLLNSKAVEPAEFPPDFSERVEEHFGLESHAAKLTATFERIFDRENQEEKITNVSDRLLNLYFRPRFHRPLIGGW
jgi:glycosyltransferase involved in cell wall biosynthesis